MRNVFVMLLICFAAACSNNKTVPDHVLKPEKFQKILADVFLADALSTERSFKDTALKIKDENAAYFLKVFEQYGVTKNEFMRSYNYYLSRPDLLRPITDSISAVLERENTKLTTDTVKPKQDGNNSPKARIGNGN